MNSYYSLGFNIIYKFACKTIRKFIKVKGNLFSAPPVYFPWFLCLPIYLKWSFFCNVPDPLTGEEDATKPSNIWENNPVNMNMHIMLKLKILKHKTY